MAWVGRAEQVPEERLWRKLLESLVQASAPANAVGDHLLASRPFGAIGPPIPKLTRPPE